MTASQHGSDIHWSYDCSTSAGGRGVFILDVFVSDRSPDTAAPGVNEQGDKDSAVYHVPGRGQFYLEITSTCKWTLKVTATPP